MGNSGYGAVVCYGAPHSVPLSPAMHPGDRRRRTGETLGRVSILKSPVIEVAIVSVGLQACGLSASQNFSMPSGVATTIVTKYLRRLSGGQTTKESGALLDILWRTFLPAVLVVVVCLCLYPMSGYSMVGYLAALQPISVRQSRGRLL